MDENPTLSEAVFNSVSGWLGDDGLVTGFIAVFSTMDSEGQQMLQVCAPDTQPFHSSLGLIGYVEEYVRDDIRTAFLAEFGGDD